MNSMADTSGNVSVRPMEPEDIIPVMEIDRKAAGGRRAITYQDQIEFYLGGELGLSYVAEQDGRVVGFIFGRLLERRYGPYQGAWLEILGIEPDMKRHGIGRQLLKALHQGCREKGVRELHAMVSARDTEVKPFLENSGFREGELVHLQLKV
ncbi:MAG: GNAT family N-acetyltransferase [Chloroflexi bacterium]|nr:GNAT family N-acetyltransferase [Chloroflexota bacterium]